MRAPRARQGRYALTGEAIGFLATGTWKRRLAGLRRPNQRATPVAYRQGLFRRVCNTDIERIESAWR